MRLAYVFIYLLIFILSGCGGGLDYRKNNRTRGTVSFGLQAANVLNENKNSLWVILDIPYRSLQFKRNTNDFTAQFEVTVALRNEEGDAVQLLDDSQTIRVTSYAETLLDSLYTRTTRFFQAPVGNYKLEAVVKDAVSGGHGYFVKSVEVRDLMTDTLALSDVLLLKENQSEIFSDRMVLPAYQKRFKKKIYAFIQAHHTKPQSRLRATLQLGNKKAPMKMIGIIDTTASQNITSFIFPISPTQLGLGKLQLKMTVTTDGSLAEATRPLLVRWAPRPATTEKFNNYIAPLQVIMPRDEWKQLRDALPNQQRAIIAKFWKTRNPSPGDGDNNMLEEEFYSRINEANGRFAWGRRAGWKTDRGKIYIINGSPIEVEHRQDRFGRPLEEIWRYEDPPRKFIFYDDHGDGRYRLYNQTYSNR